MKSPTRNRALAMDCAYEGNQTRALARKLGYKPVVPPNPRRRKPWKLDKSLYKRRNEVERLIRRLKGFRRVFTRYDKLDVIFSAHVCLALIFISLN
jgi:transposase